MQFDVILERVRINFASLRPKTLWASICPVLIGAASARIAIVQSNGAIQQPEPFTALFALTLFTSLFLQLAVNYANDYFDAMSGVDENRPRHLEVDSRSDLGISSNRTRFFATFTIGALFGLLLIYLAPITLFAKGILAFLGLLALLGVYYYSGGKHPYGHSGAADFVSFIFFGPVALIGTYYILTGGVWSIEGGNFPPISIIIKSISFGLLVMSMLMIDNLRDIETDAAAGKNSLAVKLGARKALLLFHIVVGASIVLAALVLVFNIFIIIPWLITIALGAIVLQKMRVKDYQKAFGFLLPLALCLTVVLAF